MTEQDYAAKVRAAAQAVIASRWIRAVCEDCWTREHGEQLPMRLRGLYRVEETCGLCGRPTMSGIYDRADPNRGGQE